MVTGADPAVPQRVSVRFEGLEELGVLLQRQHRHGELRHGMRLNRQRFDGGQHLSAHGSG